MIDWQDKVDRAHLICAATGVQIPAGSQFYSALRYADGRFIRSDYAFEAWDEDTIPNLVSWWKQKRPDAKTESGPRLVNHAVLLAIWNDLRESTDRTQQCFAWLLTLLLTRGKKLRYMDLEQRDGETYMVVIERGTKLAHRVRDPQMDPEEEERVQQDLQEVFTMPAAPLEDADTSPKDPSGAASEPT
ncbi:MAG: hypothetical protein PF961_21840 [Planctomycetota bacterium]|jgi:hypothetical protein|nr:hypothetical protein [Planctomycetota bacterium]